MAPTGRTTSIALKGDRLAQSTDNTSTIVDLKEERIYTVDVRKKEYSVVTFAEMRAQIEKARQDLEKQKAEMNPEDKAKVEEAARQLELDVTVKETGQRKTVAGHDASEAVLTLTLREKGKTLEESGGFVMTNTMWLGPQVASLDELAQFRLRQFKADLRSDVRRAAAQRGRGDGAGTEPPHGTHGQRVEEARPARRWRRPRSSRA